MSSVTSPEKVLKQRRQTLSEDNFMLEKLRFFAVFFLLPWFTIKNWKLKVKYKIEQKKETLCSVSTQPGCLCASISSSGITFSRNIHPKQPGCHWTHRASLPFPPAPWRLCSQGSSAGELWQVSNSIGLFPRHLPLERLLLFFGIYTFKS